MDKHNIDPLLVRDSKFVWIVYNDYFLTGAVQKLRRDRSNK